jgi:hypothetical protein
MPTILPWTSAEIGDLDVFVPAIPCLVVYTAYDDDQPESTVARFWQDAATGAVNYEVLFTEPVTLEEALARAQEQAAERRIERIHVKHAKPGAVQRGGKVKPKARSRSAARRKHGISGKPRRTKTGGRGRRTATRA